MIDEGYHTVCYTKKQFVPFKHGTSGLAVMKWVVCRASFLHPTIACIHSYTSRRHYFVLFCIHLISKQPANQTKNVIFRLNYSLHQYTVTKWRRKDGLIKISRTSFNVLTLYGRPNLTRRHRHRNVILGLQQKGSHCRIYIQTCIELYVITMFLLFIYLILGEQPEAPAWQV